MTKLDRLRKVLRDLRSVVVAYSGGLDSTFLLNAAIDTLGKRNVIAVTARSETYPGSEYTCAKRITRQLGAKHLTINTNEFEDARFTSNPVNRCYYCKRELFTALEKIRSSRKFGHVVDGTNLDDLKDTRYGTRAAEELGVKRPLLEARIGKSDIRALSKALGLKTWDKPAMACLASRIPFGTNITLKDLGRIEKGEDFLRSLGFWQVRIRLHSNVARLEFLEQELSKAVKLRKKIVNKLKSLGFTYVALDLAGYRTGSLHEAI